MSAEVTEIVEPRGTNGRERKSCVQFHIALKATAEQCAATLKVLLAAHPRAGSQRQLMKGLPRNQNPPVRISRTTSRLAQSGCTAVAALLVLLSSASAQYRWNGIGNGSQSNDWDFTANGPRNWLSPTGQIVNFSGTIVDVTFGIIPASGNLQANYTVDVGGISGGNLTISSLTVLGGTPQPYVFNQSSLFNTSITVLGPTTIDGTLNLNGSSAFPNTFLTATEGITVNNGGSLILGGSGDLIGNTTDVILNGGELNLGVNGGTETIGTLTLTSDSVLNLSGTGSSLAFTGSDSFDPGSFTLEVWNWDGSDSLLFSPQITPAELSQIVFYSDSGATLIGGGSIGPDGRIYPVPEPATIVAALGLCGVITWRERRRLNRLLLHRWGRAASAA
jgi:hypothetical protein